MQDLSVNRSEPLPKPTEKFRTPVEAPFVRLGLDIIVPLKEINRGNKYIIVCIDYFTKWVEAKPLCTTTSRDVTNFIVEVFSKNGIPQIIVIDNGVQFTSDIKIFLDLYNIYIHFVSIHHPESYDLVENRNREFGKQLRNFSYDNKNWDILLPLALWALRTSESTVSGYSSFELLYGRKELLLVDINLRNSVLAEDRLNKVWKIKKILKYMIW